jgi:hypothetical protein
MVKLPAGMSRMVTFLESMISVGSGVEVGCSGVLIDSDAEQELNTINQSIVNAITRTLD